MNSFEKSNSTIKAQSQLIDITPSEDQLVDSDVTVKSKLKVQNTTTKDLKFAVKSIKPEATDALPVFHDLKSGSSQVVKISLDNLRPNKKSLFKVVVDATNPENTKEYQEIRVKITVTPNTIQGNKFIIKAFYELTGVGIDRQFEVTETVNQNEVQILDEQASDDSNIENQKALNKEMEKIVNMIQAIDPDMAMESPTKASSILNPSKGKFKSLFRRMEQFEQKYFDHSNSVQLNTFSIDKDFDVMWKKMKAFENVYHQNFDKMTEIVEKQENAKLLKKRSTFKRLSTIE